MSTPPVSPQPPQFIARVTAAGGRRIEPAGQSAAPQVRQALRAMRRPDQKAPPRQPQPQPHQAPQTEVATAPVQSQKERTDRASRLVRQAIAIHGDPDSSFSTRLREALSELDGDKESWFQRVSEAPAEATADSGGKAAATIMHADSKHDDAEATATVHSPTESQQAVPGELPVQDTRPGPTPQPKPEDEAAGGDQDDGEQGDDDAPGQEGGDGDGDGSNEQPD